MSYSDTVRAPSCTRRSRLPAQHGRTRSCRSYRRPEHQALFNKSVETEVGSSQLLFPNTSVM